MIKMFIHLYYIDKFPYSYFSFLQVKWVSFHTAVWRDYLQHFTFYVLEANGGHFIPLKQGE